jgi:hypothetical protein
MNWRRWDVAARQRATAPGKHDFRFNFKLAQKPREATLSSPPGQRGGLVNGKGSGRIAMGKFGRARSWGYFRVAPLAARTAA